MRNIFIGVQDRKTLRPIKQSLSAYIAKLEPFDRVMIRAPFGLHLDSPTKLWFDDILHYPATHIDTNDPRITYFIGSPNLAGDDWQDLFDVLKTWFETPISARSICFEAMVNWTRQFEFCYAACKAAHREMFVEGIPRVGDDIPSDVKLILADQRLIRWLYRTDNDELDFDAVKNEKHFIMGRDIFEGKNTIFKGAFGFKPKTQDELQRLLEDRGVVVWRYP